MESIHVPKVENVKLLDRLNPKGSPLGTLYLTTSHLIFIEENAKKELWVLHMLMNYIDKPFLTTSGSTLRIICNHFQCITFVIQRDKDAHDVYQSLVELSRPKDVTGLYCFSHNPKGEMRQSTGWHFHDTRAEFQRQGVPNENWSVCTLNSEYKLCPTYPQYLFVPSCASPDVVEGSAKFRSKARLPVLTYLHKNGASMIRCVSDFIEMKGTPNKKNLILFDKRPNL